MKIEEYIQYLLQLKSRQDSHLEKVSQVFTPCTKADCPECVGTNVKIDGTACHHAPCKCSKCTVLWTTTYTSKEFTHNLQNTNWSVPEFLNQID